MRSAFEPAPAEPTCGPGARLAESGAPKPSARQPLNKKLRKPSTDDAMLPHCNQSPFGNRLEIFDVIRDDQNDPVKIAVDHNISDARCQSVIRPNERVRNGI